MRHLFTPWRYRYIAGPRKPDSGCIFCRAAESKEPAETLTLRVGREAFVLMNRYPYTNGHLMIAPRLHTAALDEVGPAARAEMMELAVASQRILGELYRPSGFNLGMNLGECAGAGIADHLHLHVVPRWPGDTNFMTTLGATRLVPEDLDASWPRLRTLFDGLGREEETR